MLKKILIVLLTIFSFQNIFLINCYAENPHYGGTLRVLGGETMVLGYPPEMGPAEWMAGSFSSF